MRKLLHPIKRTSRRRQQPKHQDDYPELVRIIVEAILSKKGEHVVTLDLREVPEAVTSFFVICDCSSSTQVRALAQGVEEAVGRQLKEYPWHIEGMEHLRWVLLDYVTVVVHIFLTPVRRFYQLEELWSDGRLTEHSA
ncbi:MAG: ribosome silencing factor [Chitinophagales bacterium]|nr:ribosome silencing factor [Chitinophagales bacterium]MDW8393045.1 ribosome silencing factor [Chitinophagales bacterium]